MLLLGKFKVSGHSMEPSIKNGQEILVSSLPFLFSGPKVGDIIAFSLARRDLAKLNVVKSVKRIKEGRYLVVGDNEKDSTEFGWIKKEAILGKVVYILGG